MSLLSGTNFQRLNLDPLGESSMSRNFLSKSTNLSCVSKYRASVFMAFGLSGVIPAIHYVYMEGWFNDISRKSLGWLILMGLLYILGAMFYALRIPERWFPGKFDLWVSQMICIVLHAIIKSFIIFHCRVNLIKSFTCL